MTAMPISGHDLASFSGPQTFMRLPEASSAEGLNVGFIGVPGHWNELAVWHTYGAETAARAVRYDSSV